MAPPTTPTLRDGHAHLRTPHGDLPLEVAASPRTRLRGLLGRDHITSALLLTPTRSIHTLLMRVPIDVAYLDGHWTVLEVHTMKPNRIGWPRWRARHVVETAAGVMHRHGIQPGTELKIIW